MIAIFNTAAKAATCSDMIHAFLILNRNGYNAERWSAPNKSVSADLWAVSLPPEPIDIADVSDFVEQYPDGWRLPLLRY